MKRNLFFQDSPATSRFMCCVRSRTLARRRWQVQDSNSKGAGPTQNKPSPDTWNCLYMWKNKTIDSNVNKLKKWNEFFFLPFSLHHLTPSGRRNWDSSWSGDTGRSKQETMTTQTWLIQLIVFNGATNVFHCLVLMSGCLVLMSGWACHEFVETESRATQNESRHNLKKKYSEKKKTKYKYFLNIKKLICLLTLK